MIENMDDHQRQLSSRNGRYWLRDMKNSRPAGHTDNAADRGSHHMQHDQLPFTSTKSSLSARAGHESVVVAIPEVAKTKKYLSDSRPITRPGTETQNTTDTGRSAATETAATPQIKPSQAAVAAAAPVSAPASPPLNRPSVKQQNHVESPDDAVAASRAGQTIESLSSIGKIANSIVDEFPVASPAVVVFVGSQVGLHSDETCARVAAELGSKGLGRVLLIDSDFANRRLSKASGMNSQAGLSEVMNIAFEWKEAILKSGSSKLDFMSAGSCSKRQWVPVEPLKEVVAQMKSEYQFICVSAGDAHDSVASMWGGLADGTLLLVSAVHSNDAIAMSALTQLRKDGARVFGCVLTDANETMI